MRSRVGSAARLAYITAMFDTLLRRLLAPAPDRLPDPDADLALAALLVRVARSDADYSATETARIDRVLAQRHGLAPTDAAALRHRAEALEVDAPDTVRFTRALKAATRIEDRTALMEALWSVALSDGARADTEDQLIRMVANLIGISDIDSNLARQRVESRA